MKWSHKIGYYILYSTLVLVQLLKELIEFLLFTGSCCKRETCTNAFGQFPVIKKNIYERGLSPFPLVYY